MGKLSYKEYLEKVSVKKKHLFEYVSRPFSTKLSYLLYFTPATGNQVSLVGILIALASIALFTQASPFWWIIAALGYNFLFQVVDCADGEIARAKGLAGKSGEYIEIVSHYALKPLLPIAMSIGLYFSYGFFELIYAGIVVGWAVVIDDLVLILNRSEGGGRPKLVSYLVKKESRLKNLLIQFCSYLGFVWFILFASIIDLFLDTHLRLILFSIFGVYFIISLIRVIRNGFLLRK